MHFLQPIFLDPINLKNTPRGRQRTGIEALWPCNGAKVEPIIEIIAAIYSWAFTAVWHVYILYLL